MRTTIKIALLVILILTMTLVIVGCATLGSTEQEIAESTQRIVVERIQYIRDPRTGLCFAYYWEHRGEIYGGNAGPALATVPCEPVAKLLSPSKLADLVNK